MITSSYILAQVELMNKLIGPLGAAVDEFGLSKVTRAGVTLDVLTIIPQGLIPVEIRKDKDTLGWLYDSKDRHIIVQGISQTGKLSKLVKIIEAGVKANKKEETTEPTEFKLLRKPDGSIWTFISLESLKEILC